MIMRNGLDASRLARSMRSSGLTGALAASSAATAGRQVPHTQAIASTTFFNANLQRVPDVFRKTLVAVRESERNSTNHDRPASTGQPGYRPASL